MNSDSKKNNAGWVMYRDGKDITDKQWQIMENELHNCLVIFMQILHEKPEEFPMETWDRYLQNIQAFNQYEQGLPYGNN